MPRTSLTAGAHRDDSRPDKFPQVKLERHEGRRLWIPDEAIAWMELRHNLKAPVFDAASGEPLKTERKIRGSVREVYDMDEGYIGSPICLGDPEVVAREKLDPENCPACAGVKRLLDAGIADALDLRPQPRYAVPVVQYVTASKTDLTKLRTPPNADILIWALSQWSWEQVDGIRSQMAEILDKDSSEVKLQMCDICVSNENGFQKIDKIWPLRRAWAHDSDFGRAVKGVVQELWGTLENRPTDDQLQAACGRKADREFMDQDIRDAEERWHKAENYGKGGPTDTSGGNYMSNGRQVASLEDGLDLLEGEPVDAATLAEHPGGLNEFADRSPAKPADDDGDLFAAAGPGPAPVPDAGDLLGAAPAESALGDDPLAASSAREPVAAGNGAGKGETQSFEDLWKTASA
jgi:hypothetical protein